MISDIEGSSEHDVRSVRRRLSREETAKACQSEDVGVRRKAAFRAGEIGSGSGNSAWCSACGI